MTKIMDGDAFTAAYNQLNKQQKLAVDTIDGPVMVVAGPGTGKTQILTLRIANILLQTDTAPESILALTFTESGAKAMRERLRGYIGSRAYQVPIFTFHGFAQMLIARYPDAYPRIIGGRPISDLEKIKLFEMILESSEIKTLRPIGNPTYYVPHIIRMLGQLKQEHVTPDALVEIIAQQEEDLLGIEKIHEKGAHKGKVRGEYTKQEKVIDKNRELLHVYQQYEALLREQGRYDFEDMIGQTVRALGENEDLLRDLQEQYQYLHADEHQDVNGAQNKILELLASFHDSPNIFAVGDEKQAIYRFQGASLENFLYFTEQFPSTKIISLTDNYRSGPQVLDAAHSLVEVEDGPLAKLRVPLAATAVKQAQVQAREFAHQAIEDDWLVQEVQSVLASGTPPEEVAVIVRTNREVEQVSAALRKAGVTIEASADGDILRHPITRAVQDLIAAVTIDKSTTALFTALHGPYWGIDTNDLLKVCAAQTYEQSLWQIITDADLLASLHLKNAAVFTQVVTVLETARAKTVTDAPHKVLEYLLQESGLIAHTIEHDPIEGTRVVRRLYDEVEELVVQAGAGSLREVSDALATRQAYGLPLSAPYIKTSTAAVQVMTAHKSKGLEFDTVLVPHVTDGSWSGAGKRTYFTIPLARHITDTADAQTEDERRLLYVAMTRAKRQLHISHSATSSDGKVLQAARLLADIDEQLLEAVETIEVAEDFDPLASLAQPHVAMPIDRALLHTVLSERGFSATSLNNYLRSPWDYLYRNVLRIPQTQALPMQFGTAMHNVLESATRVHSSKGTLPSVSDMKLKFEQELSKLPIHTGEFARLLEKGLDALAAYREHLSAVLPKQTKEELKLRVVLPTGLEELPELPLTGMLDRIDLGDDGRALRIVDYKTGKPKTRNAIEGNTKGSDGGYKRQLVFYTLLLQLHDDERYQTREGVLSFVEPTPKGEVKEETFVVTDEEIEDLKKEIIASVQSILSGEFLLEPCDDSVSEYCHLAALLQGE